MKSFYASSLRRQSKKEENAQPLEEIKLHKRERERESESVFTHKRLKETN